MMAFVLASGCIFLRVSQSREIPLAPVHSPSNCAGVQKIQVPYAGCPRARPPRALAANMHRSVPSPLQRLNCVSVCTEYSFWSNGRYCIAFSKMGPWSFFNVRRTPAYSLSIHNASMYSRSQKQQRKLPGLV